MNKVDRIVMEPEQVNELRIKAKLTIYKKFFSEFAREEEIEDIQYAFENEVLDQDVEVGTHLPIGSS